MISTFLGEHYFLSNFYLCEVEMDGEIYASAEHAYQAAKTEDELQRATIRSIRSSLKAKLYGKKTTTREGWVNVRLIAMEWIVREKFTRHPDLRAKLTATHPHVLRMGNRYGDTFWGATLSGRGQNHLGRILMLLRDEFRR